MPSGGIVNLFVEPLSPDEESILIERLKNGDVDARNTLVIRNMRLVAHIAKKYSYRERDFDDILSIGTIGLIKAVNTFNPSKGNKLVTYSCKCIDNEILMYLRSDKKHNLDISLYEPLGTDNDGNCVSLFDIIEADEIDFISEYDQKEKAKWLFENIKEILSPVEFKLIATRYGLFGISEQTQREIADNLGISRSYVSRIEKKCIKKLKLAYQKKAHH